MITIVIGKQLLLEQLEPKIVYHSATNIDGIPSTDGIQKFFKPL